MYKQAYNVIILFSSTVLLYSVYMIHQNELQCQMQEMQEMHLKVQKQVEVIQRLN